MLMSVWTFLALCLSTCSKRQHKESGHNHTALTRKESSPAVRAPFPVFPLENSLQCSPVETHLAVTLLYWVLHKTNRFSVSNQRITSIPKGQYVWFQILTVVGTYWSLKSFTENMKQWTVPSTCFISRSRNLIWMLVCCLKLPLGKKLASPVE